MLSESLNYERTARKAPVEHVVDYSNDADLARLERSRQAAQSASPAPSWRQKQMSERIHEELDLHIKQKPNMDQGFGFLIRGGRELREPVCVSAVFANSHADKAGIAVKDELLELDGQGTEDKTHSYVKRLIASAVERGELRIKLRRYRLRSDVSSPSSPSPAPSPVSNGPQAAELQHKEVIRESAVLSPYTERKHRPGRIENFVPDVQRSGSSGYRVYSLHDPVLPGKITDFVPERDRSNQQAGKRSVNSLPEREDSHWRRENERVMGKFAGASLQSPTSPGAGAKEVSPIVGKVYQPASNRPPFDSQPPREKPPSPPQRGVNTNANSQRMPSEKKPVVAHYDAKTLTQKLNEATKRLAQRADFEGSDESLEAPANNNTSDGDELCWSKMPLPGSDQRSNRQAESLDALMGKEQYKEARTDTDYQKTNGMLNGSGVSPTRRSPANTRGSPSDSWYKNDPATLRQTKSKTETSPAGPVSHHDAKASHPPPRSTKQLLRAPQLRPQAPSGPAHGSSPPAKSVSGHELCSYCGKELGTGSAMIIESLHLFYHYACFRCNVCGIVLGNGKEGTDVRVRNARLHCQTCYSNEETGIQFSEV